MPHVVEVVPVVVHEATAGEVGSTVGKAGTPGPATVEGEAVTTAVFAGGLLALAFIGDVAGVLADAADTVAATAEEVTTVAAVSTTSVVDAHPAGLSVGRGANAAVTTLTVVAMAFPVAGTTATLGSARVTVAVGGNTGAALGAAGGRASTLDVVVATAVVGISSGMGVAASALVGSDFTRGVVADVVVLTPPAGGAGHRGLGTVAVDLVAFMAPSAVANVESVGIGVELTSALLAALAGLVEITVGDTTRGVVVRAVLALVDGTVADSALGVKVAVREGGLVRVLLGGARLAVVVVGAVDGSEGLGVQGVGVELRAKTEAAATLGVGLAAEVIGAGESHLAVDALFANELLTSGAVVA